MHEDGSFGAGYVEWMNKVKADDEDFYNKLIEVEKKCQATGLSFILYCKAVS